MLNGHGENDELPVEHNSADEGGTHHDYESEPSDIENQLEDETNSASDTHHRDEHEYTKSEEERMVRSR